MRNIIPVLIALSVSVFPVESNAEMFQAGFISFDLPNDWKCNKEELDWVCSPKIVSTASDIIIVAVSKSYDADVDHLDKYLDYLKKPHEKISLSNTPYQSVVKFARQSMFQDHPWIDALHLGSEIPGFYTRYLATYKEKSAAMFAITIAQSKYDKYAELSEKIVRSLKITFDQKTYDDALAMKGPLFGSMKSTSLRTAPVSEIEKPKIEKADIQWNEYLEILAIILIVIALIFIFKRLRSR